MAKTGFGGGMFGGRKEAGASGGGAEALRFLAQMASPFFALDRAGKVVAWNAACARLTGVSASEVMGTRNHWRAFYAQERPCLADLVLNSAGANVSALYAGAGDAKDGAKQAQNWCDLPTGGRRYLQIDACPVRDARGQIEFVVETLQDFTVLKEAEMAVEATRAAQAEELSRLVSLLGQGLDHLAKGDLTARVREPLPAGADALRTNFNAAAEALQQLLGQVTGAAGAMDAGAGQIAGATADLSRRTDRLGAGMNEAASALSAMTATVSETARVSSEADRSVARAMREAEGSGAVVKQAIDAIHQIATSSEQISHIVGVIDEIAFQTNLLALNAGVEAARAGESGRGFAVVATEVRALAGRSAEAAKEIENLIRNSKIEVERGVDLVARAGASLQGIVDQVGELSGIVSTIAHGAQSQAAGIAQINGAMGEVRKLSDAAADLVAVSARAADDLVAESRALKGVTDLFEIGEGRSSRSRVA